jgi:hypothetical protein
MTRATSLDRFREAARAFPCPTCGAEAGKNCVGARGKERISTHQSRANLVRGERPTVDMSKIEIVGDRDASGFVLYAIREKATGRFGYVGQTGNFATRIRSHALTGFRGSGTKKLRSWMHDILAAGEILEIVLLARCVSEEGSLALEAEWVGKLTEAGHDLSNRWRVHQDAIKEVRLRR